MEYINKIKKQSIPQAIFRLIEIKIIFLHQLYRYLILFNKVPYKRDFFSLHVALKTLFLFGNRGHLTFKIIPLLVGRNKIKNQGGVLLRGDLHYNIRDTDYGKIVHSTLYSFRTMVMDSQARTTGALLDPP